MTDRSAMKAIGGSNIASLLGMSSFESAHSLYLRLVDEIPSHKDSEAMRWGRELESRVADMFADGHDEYEVVPTGIIVHPDYDYLIASPDRILLLDGEPSAVLEIKTADISTRHLFGMEKTDEIPEQYYCQVIWYMGMLDISCCWVAVYFRKEGRKAFADYKEYIVNANPEWFDAMLRRAVHFWTEHVEKRVPPPITEADNATIRYYRDKYPYHDPDKWLLPTDDLDNLVVDLMGAKAALDTAEKAFELRKVQMLAALGACEGYKSPWGNITFRASKPTQKTDWKAVADALSAPQELINQFTQEVPGSRRFLLPKMKT